MYVETVIGIVGVGVGVFTTYTLLKINNMQRQVNLLREVYEEFPTPEEMAKKVLSTKLPVSELPEDVQQNIMNAAKKFYQGDETTSPHKEVNPGYMG